MVLGVVDGLLDGAVLLGAKPILDRSGRLQDAVVLAELVEAHLRGIGLYLIPLGIRLVRDVELLQVAVEVGVAKRLARILVCRVAVPLDDVVDIGRVGLLLDARFDVLLGVPDLRPSVVPRDFGRGVGVDLGQYRAARFNFAGDIGEGHGYSISFTCDSMKSISFSSSPYLA